ncbi:hypothetical protein M0811_10743 [Anaeramoeba ignava]|uniref:MULE transposase domain-containing protein n=1 Tax=Anaeramoeba ignava TaxID=1746090 RepID=A0A9Q0LFR2_ANAIG|nr:hypothetical protein M0811_10743 [Anaeramoeba ignava]
MYIPTHYIALTDNSKNLYKYALNFLFTFLLQNQIKLSYITCDFEWTLQQALKETIPQAKIVGCFFHFKKAVQAKLMKFAPTPTEEEKQIIMEEIEILTFIPPEEIEGKVQELANKFSKFSKFFQYFRTTWLKKYGHSRWNIHSYPNLWERTNNPLEGYHKKLNSILKHEKPNICKMAELLINEEDYYRRKMMENLNQWSNHPVDEKREETKQWMNRMKVYLDQRKEKSNLQMTNSQRNKPSPSQEKRRFHCSLCGSPYHTKKKCSLNPQNK